MPFRAKAVCEQLSVVLLGLEPRQTEPESAVLPLHHRTIVWNAAAKVMIFLKIAQNLS